MCGIIGINSSSSSIVDDVLSGLKSLEYRGYDSAGVAGIINKKISLVKVKGKISNLALEVEANKFCSNIAIGHTRWATHGAANQINAHPHFTDEVAVVHNGIIENYQQIKEELQTLGHKFHSQTDSEVIPHLITHFLRQGNSPLEAVFKSINRLEGAFSIAVIFEKHDKLMIVARKGSPLIIGCMEDKMAVASDAYAISFLTNKIIYLEEGDVAVLTSKDATIYDNKKNQVKREISTIDINMGSICKGNYRHFMLKEIFEQPTILANTINAYYDSSEEKLNFDHLSIDFAKLPKITLVACGTSYYSSMVAKYWLEKIINIPIEVEIASEFRYRNSYLPEGGLAIFLSQSGETADTLAALRYAKQKKQICLSIVNVKASSLDREADFSLQCFAGPEISVASTKGFTTQLTILLLLTIHIGEKIGYFSGQEKVKNLHLITEIPGRIAEVLNSSEEIKNIAKEIATAKNSLFIGRNYIYPVALEGALKLKELSYIHAEAIAAGELKHGPIALIDEEIPVIVLAPYNNFFDKTSSNAQEIAARGGKIISLSSKQGNEALFNISKHRINISSSDSLIEPIIYAIPMQLLAYYVAVLKGTDVDQPRNLAKSVTVE